MIFSRSSLSLYSNWKVFLFFVCTILHCLPVRWVNLDSREDIIRKFKRAVTDSEARICVAEGKDGINNLIDIYSVVTGLSVEETVKKFEGFGYGDFKLAVGEAVADTLDPVRERYNEYVADKKKLEELAKMGAEKAYYASRKTMSKVMKKVGFVL